MLKMTTVANLVDNQFKVNAALCRSDNWLTHKNDWESAIMAEAVEAIEAIGFEWWRPTEVDRTNLLIELSDMLAFSLGFQMQGIHFSGIDSKEEVRGLTAAALFNAISEANTEAKMPVDWLADYAKGKSSIKEFITFVPGLRPGMLTRLFTCALYCGFTTDELLAMYAAKSVLNVFRTENGYREGTYFKKWFVDGETKEDNYFLANLVMTEDFKDIEVGSHIFEVMVNTALKEELGRQLTAQA